MLKILLISKVSLMSAGFPSCRGSLGLEARLIAVVASSARPHLNVANEVRGNICNNFNFTHLAHPSHNRPASKGGLPNLRAE